MVGRQYENGGIAKDGGAKTGDGRRQCSGSALHRHYWWVIWRRELWNERARLLPTATLDVAQRPHLGHGRQAGGQRAGNGAERETWPLADKP